jgi:hypothetical protein
MKRLHLEKTPPAVRQFIRGLVDHPEVVEFEENGRVLLRILAAPRLNAESKTVLLRQGRDLVRRARERNRNVPARTLDKEVRKAVSAVGRNPQ